MAMPTETAISLDGRSITFVPSLIGEGLMKRVYFTTDQASVVCFFKDQADRQRLARLQAVVGKFNPTLDPESGRYWKSLYCWPTAIVRSPTRGLGIVAPRYPNNFLFSSGPWPGKEKQGKWFFGRSGGGKPLLDMLPPAERGDWLAYLRICIHLARAVRRLHMAGLAHSDLSSKNVLVDPMHGHAIIIDIDSLVVPGIFPPDVAGTAEYIAPEVLASAHLPFGHPGRRLPNILTDQHALAVLVYQYLLLRHPLRGPRICAVAPDEDELQSMGPRALFVEHPTDHSNWDPDIRVPLGSLGPELTTLCHRAFINGLHNPNHRPAATEWESALNKTFDAVLPCGNTKCRGRWFPVSQVQRIACPWCGAMYGRSVPLLRFRTERKPGQWVLDGQAFAYDQWGLFKWHVSSTVRVGEHADPARQAHVRWHDGKWVLVNEALSRFTSMAGNRVGPNQAVELTNGSRFRLSEAPGGRMVEVQLVGT